MGGVLEHIQSIRLLKMFSFALKVPYSRWRRAEPVAVPTFTSRDAVSLQGNVKKAGVQPGQEGRR